MSLELLEDDGVLSLLLQVALSRATTRHSKEWQSHSFFISRTDGKVAKVALMLKQAFLYLNGFIKFF
ncbi:hypothetical protein ND16A_1611 [Thalassotalea sp. ND16A]|nr:hypothetical protein ND16A_1611 [Thalassotalea sp. ND16A]